jgi:speckle-type POZ protein
MDSPSVVVKFKINYEQTKHLAAGHAINSDAISVGGHMWRINFYPHGVQETPEEGKDNPSIFLELLRKSRNTRVEATFTTSIKNMDGEVFEVESSWSFPSERYFDILQLFHFGSHTDMVNNYVKDGHIKFVCTIMVLQSNSIPVPLSNIGKHMGTLLDSMDGMDVSFVIDGETFHAHRFVLAARSPVFKAKLFGSMAEATKMSSITLHEIAPATFKLMLQFMYTDALPGDEELGNTPIKTLWDLLAAADYYALDRLKLLCAQKLWDNASVDTVASTLACAEMYNCPELKDKCIEFFAEANNFKEAVLTDGFVKLMQQFPSIVSELRERIGT